MLELAIPIREVFEKSALTELESWFAPLPDDAAWYVLSDYCIGDEKKENDVVSFSILLNHDKLSNIQKYINAFAPKDIKSTRSVSREFLQYINAPIIFNVSFVIDRNSKLLKDHASRENMESFLPDFLEFVRMTDLSSSFENGFAEAVQKRAGMFLADFKRKNFNLDLSRRIYLVGTLAGLIFHYLNKTKSPFCIAWVSDRDALIQRYEGFIFDLAYFTFLSECSREITERDGEKVLIDKPKFIFQTPAITGSNEYDELVRIPDYLAGTLADVNIETGQFSKEKYYTVHNSSLLNSKNHAIIHVRGSGLDIHTRRLVFI